MPDKKSLPPSEKVDPKQKTQKGLEIPVPKRKDVLRDLEKIAAPPPATPPPNAR